MEKKVLIENFKTLILETINGILAIFTAAGTIIIMSLHFVIDISFFPILFIISHIAHFINHKGGHSVAAYQTL